MQAAYCFFETEVMRSVDPKRSSSGRGFRFVSRDLDILEFILEMKFSDLELIHQKFFSMTSLGIQSTSQTWARQRIQNLLKAGMILKVSDVCKQPLLTVTQKGFFYLQNRRPSEDRPRPLLSVDPRTFEHDRLVSEIRIALEKSGACTSWTSERTLYDSEIITRQLSSEYRPDGIYLNSEGKKVAIEVELSRKSKDRYTQKIKRYVRLMTENAPDPSVFDAVHYVCQKPQILELLRSETQIYSSFFKFSLLSDFLKGEQL